MHVSEPAFPFLRRLGGRCAELAVAFHAYARGCEGLLHGCADGVGSFEKNAVRREGEIPGIPVLLGFHLLFQFEVQQAAAVDIADAHAVEVTGEDAQILGFEHRVKASHEHDVTAERVFLHVAPRIERGAVSVMGSELVERRHAGEELGAGRHGLGMVDVYGCHGLASCEVIDVEAEVAFHAGLCAELLQP